MRVSFLSFLRYYCMRCSCPISTFGSVQGLRSATVQRSVPCHVSSIVRIMYEMCTALSSAVSTAVYSTPSSFSMSRSDLKYSSVCKLPSCVP